MQDNYRKIIEYRLITSHDQIDLADKVNNLIDKGWQPVGPANNTITSNDYIHYIQTVVKYEDKVAL